MRSIICLTFLCLVALLDGKRYRCDYTYMAQANGWMKLHKVPANWHEARLRCHLEGGILASPLNDGMMQAMKYLITTHVGASHAVFTGIHATISRGDFFSIEGVPLSKIPHKWGNNEPDNINDSQSCIAIFDDTTFFDIDCKETHPYICYKKAPQDVNLTNCGTIDTEYSLDPRTGSCYKFHKVPRTWSRGYMACAAEGGYLTVVNNDVEAEVLLELFARNPAVSMVGSFWKDVALIGFQDWGEHGEWLTVDGRTLQEAGYAKFSPGEPNNSTPGEFCGAIYRNAMLDDISCENNYAFICEKSPDSLLCEGDKN